jgi:hypothetical protein
VSLGRLTLAYSLRNKRLNLNQRVFAPTTDYDSEVVNTFFPLSGQMNLGGGSDPECSDGVDNDGDGQTDFPSDAGCSSTSDDSETG